MRTAAILPVKRFARAKSRLGESVADELRLTLARAMVGDVLCALHECAAIDLTIVVSSESTVTAAAAYLGALVVQDTAEEGQSAAARLGLERALEEGAERALCIPGDCPALDPSELDALLRCDAQQAIAEDAHPAPTGAHPAPAPHPARAETTPEVVVIPDRHGTGTNGLLLSPPDAILPSFGPGSCERHRELARTAGVACRVEHPQSLLLDIDTGADLDALRERLASDTVRAPRTRAVLGLEAERRPILTAP